MSGFVIDFGLPNAGLSGQTALGSNQATAYVLTKKVTVFSSVPTGTGANLPSSYAPGVSLTLCNRDNANAMSLYPGVGDQIEANGINTPVTIPAGSNFTFVSFDPVLSVSPRTWWQTETYSLGSYLPLAGGTLTGPLSFAHWTTAGRPGVPTLYATGWNTTLSYLESWNGTAWVGMLQATGGTVTGTIGFSNSGNMTWSNTGFVWSGAGSATAGQTLINQVAEYFGTATGSGGALVALGLNQNITVGLDASGVGGAAGTNINMQSSNLTKGGITGHVNYVNIGVATANTGTVEYVGGRDFAYAFVNDGGTGGSPRGSLLGRTIVSSLQASATHWAGQTGLEVALDALTGSSTPIKTGIYIMEYADDAVRGSSADNAFAMWNQYAQGATTGWKTLVNLGASGQTGLYFPGGFDCTLIKASKGASDGSLTADTLIDFLAIDTVTSWIFRSSRLTVDGQGGILGTSIGYIGAGNHTFVISGAGTSGVNAASADGNLLTIANGSPGSTITTTIGLTSGVGAGLINVAGSATNASLFINAKGNGQIGFQAGAPTTIDSLGNINAPSIANGVAGIQVGLGTGNTQIGGGTALATNSTVGMVLIPSCAGVPSGNVGALGKVALIWDSTDNKLYVGVGGTWKGVVLA